MTAFSAESASRAVLLGKFFEPQAEEKSEAYKEQCVCELSTRHTSSKGKPYPRHSDLREFGRELSNTHENEHCSSKPTIAASSREPLAEKPTCGREIEQATNYRENLQKC